MSVHHSICPAMWARLQLSWTALLKSVPHIAAATCSAIEAECLKWPPTHALCWVPASVQSVLCGLASSCGLSRLLFIQYFQQPRTETMASSVTLVWSDMLLPLHSNVKASPGSGGRCKDSKATLQRNVYPWCQFLPLFGSLPI